jgi:hypothetical protein
MVFRSRFPQKDGAALRVRLRGAVLEDDRSVSVGSNVAASDLFASRITMSLTIFDRVTETSARTRSRTSPSNAAIASASASASGSGCGSLAIGAVEDRAAPGAGRTRAGPSADASARMRRTSREVSASSKGTAR